MTHERQEGRASDGARVARERLLAVQAQSATSFSRSTLVALRALPPPPPSTAPLGSDVSARLLSLPPKASIANKFFN